MKKSKAALLLGAFFAMLFLVNPAQAKNCDCPNQKHPITHIPVYTQVNVPYGSYSYRRPPIGFPPHRQNYRPVVRSHIAYPCTRPGLSIHISI